MTDDWIETKAAWARFKVSWRRLRREHRLNSAMSHMEKAANILSKEKEGALELKTLLLAVEIGSLP